MTAKLKIDLTAGTLEAEGDEAFVREMHAQFMTYAATKPNSKTGPIGSAPSVQTIENEDASRTSGRGKRPSGSSGGGKSSALSDYQPTFLKEFDATGLRDLYEQYVATSHPEKILVFGIYLRDTHGLDTFTADHIFTCYRDVGVKTPKAFIQALRDAATKKHFIDYQNPQTIKVINHGQRYFDHDLKKAVAK